MAGFVYAGDVNTLSARDQAWAAQRAASAQQGIQNLMQTALFVENIRRANQAAQLQKEQLAQALMLDRERRGQEAALAREEMASRAASALDVQRLRNQGELDTETKRQAAIAKANRQIKEDERAWRKEQAEAEQAVKEAAARLKYEQDTFEALKMSADRGTITPDALAEAYQSVEDPGIRLRISALAKSVVEQRRQLQRAIDNEAAFLNSQLAEKRKAVEAARSAQYKDDWRWGWLGGNTAEEHKAKALKDPLEQFNAALADVSGRMSEGMIESIRYNPVSMLFERAVDFGESGAQPAPVTQQRGPAGSGMPAPDEAGSQPIDVSGMPMSAPPPGSPVTLDDIITARSPNALPQDALGAIDDSVITGQPAGVKVPRSGFSIDGRQVEISMSDREQVARDVQRLLSLRGKDGRPLHDRDSAIIAALHAVHLRKMNELRGQ